MRPPSGVEAIAGLERRAYPAYKRYGQMFRQARHQGAGMPARALTVMARNPGLRGLLRLISAVRWMRYAYPPYGRQGRRPAIPGTG